jgi:hypothetical protein
MAKRSNRKEEGGVDRGKLKAHIGDVAVCVGIPRNNNPYGQGLIGEARSEALRRFRHNEDVSRYTFWFAPSSGGARRIKWPEIDWESSGV